MNFLVELHNKNEILIWHKLFRNDFYQCSHDLIKKTYA
jgi:hypothetical protein